MLDAGEFQGEVRPLSGEAARAAGFIVIDGPVVGLLLNLGDENGAPVFEVVDQVSLDVYPFTPVNQAAPVASPTP